jgi:hypothetical protein
MFFGAELCLIIPEWSVGSHWTKLGVISLARPGFNDLHRVSVALYEASPTYDEWVEGTSVTERDSLAVHKLRRLYGQFVTSIRDHIGRMTMGFA